MPQLAIIPFIIKLVIVIAVSKIAQHLTSQSPKLPTLNASQSVEYSGTVEPRRIVYGLNLVSGMNAIPPWCHGINNDYLDQLLVLAGHEVNAVTDIYFGQTLIASANISAITGSANDGLVTSGRYANYAWIRRYTGAASQTVDWILNHQWAAWDANHKFLGNAYVALSFKYDSGVYSQGKPNPIRALVQGKKIYDPRLDTTPGANPTNPSYIQYSNNPALVITDYICDGYLGVGETPTRMDWASVVTAANHCDELVNIPGSLTQKRFTCNVILDCSAPYEDNLKLLAQSMLGSVLYSGGQWHLLAGTAQAFTFTLTDDDLAGKLEERGAIPYKDRYNAVRGQLMDASNFYQPMEYPPYRVTADETTDGEGPIWHDANFQCCTDQWEAQRNSIITQRLGRRKRRWTGDFGPSVFPVRPGEWGYLNNSEWGLSSQPVRCVSWRAQTNGMITLTLDECGASDFNDPAVGVYQNPTAIVGPPPVGYIPQPVTGLGNAAVPGGIQFAWQLPSVWYSALNVELLEAASNNIAGASVVWSGINTGTLLQRADQVTRYYWVRVRNTIGNTYSDTNPSGATSGMSGAAALAAAAGATRNVTSYASSAPGSPGNGDIWVDTSVNPNVTRMYIGGAWYSAATNVSNTNQLTDGANLGGTAIWQYISGTGKAGDFATAGKSLVPPVDNWYRSTQPIVTLTDGKVGATALQLNGGAGYPNSINFVPIDWSKKYRVKFWARYGGGNTVGRLYFSLRQSTDAIGTWCAGNGGRAPYKPSGIDPPGHDALFGSYGLWGEYSYVWDVNDWQTGMHCVQPDFLDNYPGASGFWQVQGFVFEEVTDAILADTPTLIARGVGHKLIAPNAVDRPTGGGTWDADCFSQEGYAYGAFCSFKAFPNSAQSYASGYYMAGLTRTPQADMSYASVDFTWYQSGSGTLYIYALGASQGSFGTAANGDVLAVVYDGTYVRWLQNGTVKYTYGPWVTTSPLYFDCSNVSAMLTNIRFGPISFSAYNTNQLTDGAGLGTTATWGGVSGTGKPADNATKNTLYIQSSAPGGATNGDLWFDTTNNAWKVYSGGWTLASDITASKTAAAIAGQGALATLGPDGTTITTSGGSILIATGGVSTPKIVDHAVTDGSATVLSSGTLMGNNAYSSIMSAPSYTPATTGDIMIDVGPIAWCGSNSNFKFRLKRDSTVLLEWPGASPQFGVSPGSVCSATVCPAQYIDTLHSTAARTYSLEAYATNTTTQCQPGTWINIRELKK